MRSLKTYLTELFSEHSEIELKGVPATYESVRISLKNVFVSLSAHFHEGRRMYFSFEEENDDNAVLDWQTLTEKINLDQADDILREGFLRVGPQLSLHEERFAFDLLRRRISDFKRPLTEHEVNELFCCPSLELWLSRWHHLLIEGHPGSGKTTALKYIIWAILSKEDAKARQVRDLMNFSENTIPVYISLAKFTTVIEQQSSITSREAIHRYLDSICPELNKQKPENLVLLFDGLDEMPTISIRNIAAKMISGLAGDKRGYRVIVTSRPSGLEKYVEDSLKRTGKLGHVSVNRLSLGDMRYFIKTWYSALKVPNSNESIQSLDNRVEELVQQIEKNKDILQIACSPVLLTGLLLLHIDPDTRLPDHRTQLYHLWLKALLGRRSLDNIRGADTAEKLDNALCLFSEIAYELHLAGKQDISLGDLLEHAPKYFMGGTIDIQNQCIGLAEQSGLLRQVGLSKYRFEHRTFQEFLAALWIFKEELLPDYISYLGTSYWLEVFLFYFEYGILENIDTTLNNLRYLFEYVDAIDESNMTQARVNYFGMLAQILVTILPSDDKNFSIRGLVYEYSPSLVKTISLPAKDDQIEARLFIGEILGIIGDPRIQKNPWVSINSGQFWCGAIEDDPEAIDHERPGRLVLLGTSKSKIWSFFQKTQIAYHIARWPVTVGEYQAFCDDNGYGKDRYWSPTGLRWRNSKNIVGRYVAFKQELSNWPASCVSWYEACAYAKWLTEIRKNQLPAGWCIRLPTEAEWERAARGVTSDAQSKIYPWGRIWAPRYALSATTSKGHPGAVGLFQAGNSSEGLWDCCGNLWEWCLDYWSEDYQNIGSDNPINLIPEFGKVAGRVARGGSWDSSKRFVRISCRRKFNPGGRLRFRGFRLVMGPLVEGYDE